MMKSNSNSVRALIFSKGDFSLVCPRYTTLDFQRYFTCPFCQSRDHIRTRELAPLHLILNKSVKACIRSANPLFHTQWRLPCQSSRSRINHPPFELIPGHLSLNTTSIIGAIPLQTQSQVNIISFPIEIPWKSHRSPMEIHFPPSWILFCTDTKCSAGVFATHGVSGDLRGELFGNIWEWKVCYIYKYIVYRVYVYIYMYRITIYIYTLYIYTLYIYALYIYIYIIIITFKYYIYIYYIYYIHTLYDFNTIYDFFYDIELT